jgi:hypothetical protein
LQLTRKNPRGGWVHCSYFIGMSIELNSKSH